MPKTGRGGLRSRGGPEGRTVWQPEQPLKTGRPESPGYRPAPRSVLSPPGFSSNFSASKIRSRPHASRAPLPAFCWGAAMTGVECVTCDPLRLLSRPRTPPCWVWQEAHSSEGGVRPMGRGWLGWEHPLYIKYFLRPSSLPWKKTPNLPTCTMNYYIKNETRISYHEIICIQYENIHVPKRWETKQGQELSRPKSKANGTQ